MQAETDVVIIGGGIVGCTAAWFMANNGIDVTLFEKGEIAGEQSSRAWGFIRQQRRDPSEMPMMMHANFLWRQMPELLGVDFEWTPGGVLAAPGDEPTWDRFSKWIEVSEEFGLDTQLLSPAQVREKLPNSTGKYLGGIFTPSDGHAEPGKATRAFAVAAEKAGATILPYHIVTGIDTAGGKVIGVHTDRGSIRTSTAVVAAGAHSPKVARMVGLRLPMVAMRSTVMQTTPIHRITYSGWWAPDISFRQKPDGTIYVGRMGPATYDLTLDSFRFAKEFLPVHIRNKSIRQARIGTVFFDDVKSLIPGTEQHQHPYYRKVGIDPQPDVDQALEGLRRLQALLPEIKDLRIQRAWAGVIDQTPDTVPIIGPTSAMHGLLFATGLSGKGFGLGPAIGELLMELVKTGQSELDISYFSYDRFLPGGRLARRSATDDAASRAQE